MSIGPMVGMIRRRGRSIHSVITYDQRIHGEYGEIEIHVEMTRTSSASFMSANAQESSNSGTELGSATANVTWRRTLPTISKRPNSTMPPTTMARNVNHGRTVRFG